MKIGYLIPSCAVSGGIQVVCQHANRLINRGYDVSIICYGKDKDLSWFPNQKAKVYGINDYPYIYDIVVSTWWEMSFILHQIKAHRKFNFIQSDETRFYDNEDWHKFYAKQSYNFDFEIITEAKWIQKWLLENFGKPSHYIPNGLDLNIVKQTEPLVPKGKKYRVLLEGGISYFYKRMEDAFKVVKDIDCEVWCVSNAGTPKDDWKCDRFFQKVPFSEMKKIYSSCDTLLKMSSVEGVFGPPLEMMACGGTCVISKVSGFDEYIKDKYNALVVEQGDIESAKDSILMLMNNNELRQKLIDNGKKTALEYDWEASIDKLENAFNSKPLIIDGHSETDNLRLYKKNTEQFIIDQYFLMKKYDELISHKDLQIEKLTHDLNLKFRQQNKLSHNALWWLTFPFFALKKIVSKILSLIKK